MRAWVSKARRRRGRPRGGGRKLSSWASVYDRSRLTIDDAARAIRLLEELVVIPSVTGAEGPVLDFLAGRFESRGLTVDSQEVSPGRRNLFIHRGNAQVVFMTHADTVPPFFPPRRSGGALAARGACDAKGSLAAQTIAFEDLVREGKEVGLLVLVGEERDR